MIWLPEWASQIHLTDLDQTHNTFKIFILHILKYCFCLIQCSQFSCSVVSDSLWLHGLQHTRLPCPSPTLWACPNSCPLTWWSIQPSHPLSSPSPPAFQSFPASGSFLMSQLISSGGQTIGVSASSSVLPVNIQDWSLGLTGLVSLQSKGLKSLLQHHSSKTSILQRSDFITVQLSYMTTG